MKKFILLCVLLAACAPMSLYGPDYRFSDDGKYVSYQAMKLLAPVRADKVFIPAQTLEPYQVSESWYFYSVKYCAPYYPHGQGLAISKKNSGDVVFWVTVDGAYGALPIVTDRNLKDVRYELVEIKKPL